jgi:deoxyribonuclease-4
MRIPSMPRVNNEHAPVVPPAPKHPDERLGAHVSIRGGPRLAPERGIAIGASAIQVFTKNPNQWRDPEIDRSTGRDFVEAYNRSGLNGLVGHDSYLINLASPDPALRDRSIDSFVAELERCQQLGIARLVSHPGNYIDDRDAGLARNAEGCTIALERARSDVMVLLETTAGSGTALGRSFEELAALRRLVPNAQRHRIGFCADTCHLYAAGYDLVRDYDGMWQAFDDIIGLEHLHCLHLNDSKTPFASHRDRHELVGEGSLGPEPFKRVMRDPRFVNIAKILETPKGDDEVTLDRRMLARLRGYARAGARRHR